jgi:hypothetical protein
VFAQVGPSAPPSPTADAAIADLAKDTDTTSYHLVGPDPKGVRYSLEHSDGTVTEAIVAQDAQGWHVVETIGC